MIDKNGSIVARSSTSRVIIERVARATKCCKRTITKKLAASLDDITAETRVHFGIPELFEISTQFVTNTVDNVFFPELDRLRFRFHLSGKTYFVEYYVANLIRIHYETFQPLRSDIVTFRRLRDDIEHIHSIETTRELGDVTVTSVIEKMQNVQRLYEIFNGRADTINKFVHDLIGTYGKTDRFQRKQTVRIVLFAHKTKDGIFAQLPFDLIRMICVQVLKEKEK